jgi:hypothetical protein
MKKMATGKKPTAAERVELLENIIREVVPVLRDVVGRIPPNPETFDPLQGAIARLESVQ